MISNLMEEARQLQPAIVADRRTLHENPETGFDLQNTRAYVRRQLEAMGLAPAECGRAGLVALVGGKKPGKVFLLRADMDALPIREQADVLCFPERPDARLRPRYAHLDAAGRCAAAQGA